MDINDERYQTQTIIDNSSKKARKESFRLLAIEEGEIRARFQHDALRELDLLDHPKAQQIFEFAWQEGHACGFSDVWYYLCEIADLVR